MGDSGSCPRPDTIDLRLAHRAVLAEAREILRHLDSVVDGDSHTADLVGNWATRLIDFTDACLSGEQDLLWPLVISRIAESHVVESDKIELREIVELHRRQHRVLAEQLRSSRDSAVDWQTSANTFDAKEFSERLHPLVEALREHVADEERQMLPLFETYLTPAEWSRFRDLRTVALPPVQALLQFGASVEAAANRDERSRLTANLSQMHRLVWILAGRPMRWSWRHKMRVLDNDPVLK